MKESTRIKFWYFSIMIFIWANLCYSQTLADDSVAVRSILDCNDLSTIDVFDVCLVEDNRIVELFLFFEDIYLIPSEIGALSKLKGLYLSNNNLSELPSEIGQLSELGELWINDNNVSQLPSEFAKLAKLDSLSLSSNSFTAIPPVIFSLKTLKTLYLAENNIDKIPEDIIACSHIQTLSLANNSITHLPDQIIQLKPEKLLDLGYNKLNVSNTKVIEWATTYDPDWKNTQITSSSINKAVESMYEPLHSFTLLPKALHIRLSSTSVVSVSVYTSKGVLIKTLVNEKKHRGNHVIPFSLPTLGAGVYVLHFSANAYHRVKKYTIIY